MINWLRRLLRLVGYQGLDKERTDLKRAHEELVQERDLLRALIDSIPDPIYVKDTESRCIISLSLIHI